MARITHTCSECHKLAHEVNRTPVLFAPNHENVILECGHSYFAEKSKEFRCPDFAFADGTKLYPFQKENVELLYKSGFRAGVFDEMGLGKGGIKSGKIITPKGYSTYGEIQIGDDITGVDGKSHKVTGVYQRGKLQTYRVSFSDGTSTIVDGDHLWEVNTALRKWQGLQPRVKRTIDLKDDLFTASKNSTGKKNYKWYIPITESVKFESKFTLIDPYILGLLLGDGGFTQKYITYSSNDLELIEIVTNCTKENQGTIRTNNNTDFVINSIYIDECLREYSLKGLYSNDKFIPIQYKFNHESVRIAILQGLMDTDGSIGDNGVIEYTTVSEKLKDDVKFLVQSFGGICYESSRIPTYDYKEQKLQGQLAYRLILNIPINPFRLARKACKYQPNKKYNPTRAIVSIEEESFEEVVCISVNSPRNLYLTNDFIVTHNTISALAILRISDLHPELINPDSIYPVGILVKAGLRYQWLKEVWTKLGKFGLIVENGAEPNFDLFKIHIYSQDSLRNNESRGELPYRTIILDECQQIKNPESKRTKAIIDLIQARVIRKDNKNPIRRARIQMIAKDLMSYHGLSERFQFFFSELDRNKLGLTEVKTVKDGLFAGKITINRFHAENDDENEVIETILHEIAHALSPGAGHSRIWSDCAKSIGSNGIPTANCEGSVEIQNTMNSVRNIVALSGTPIKNHAGEFFPVLNILRPEKFPSYNGFLRYWTRSYFGAGKSVKLGGLSSPEKFGEFTRDFLIRHERKDVLPDLPPIQRNFIVNVLADNLESSYSEELREFIKKYEESKEGQEVSNVLAIMARMRHIVGLSKTQDAIEWISEFIESHNGEEPKLTIFHHHEDVGKILFVGLSRYCRENSLPSPIWLSEPGISDEERQKRVNEFVSGPRQLLIASTLKSGEGLNLQICHHALIVERQWNPANEEQAEGRFSRIGSTADKIDANYLICAGSIDEMFSEIVERKRQYIGESNAALSGKAVEEVTKWNESSVMSELARKLFETGRKKFSLQGVK